MKRFAGADLAGENMHCSLTPCAPAPHMETFTFTQLVDSPDGCHEHVLYPLL
jgi:hypothetical protein